MPETAAAPTLSRHELEAKIARKAWQDEAFRAEFVADPAAAFVKYAGVPAAQLPRIVVHQEQPGSWHIVLPAKPAGAGELSDQELEKIAGGITPALGSIIVASLVAGSVAVDTAANQGW